MILSALVLLPCLILHIPDGAVDRDTVVEGRVAATGVDTADKKFSLPCRVAVDDAKILHDGERQDIQASSHFHGDYTVTDLTLVGSRNKVRLRKRYGYTLVGFKLPLHLSGERGVIGGILAQCG